MGIAGRAMRKIADLFLRSKHWQIFVMVCVAYIAAVAASSALEVKAAPVGAWANFSTAVLLIEVAWAPLVFCYMGWIASVGLFLNSALEAGLKLRTRFFRFALMYAVLYFFVAPPVFLGTNPRVWRILIFLHLFALFCILYALNFVAKALKTAEQGRLLIMNEHGKELLLVL